MKGLKMEKAGLGGSAPSISGVSGAPAGSP